MAGSPAAHRRSAPRETDGLEGLGVGDEDAGLGLEPDPPDIVGRIELERGQPRPEGHVIAFVRTGELEELEPREVDQAEPIGPGILSPR